MPTQQQGSGRRTRSWPSPPDDGPFEERCVRADGRPFPPPKTNALVVQVFFFFFLSQLGFSSPFLEEQYKK